MARITLFRHAKAELANFEVSDFERSLASRGRLNAERMGRFVLENGMLPELVLVSPANRTRETHALASQHWPDIPVQFVDSIYEASATALMLAIEAAGAHVNHVMLIGHNPGLVVLLNQLVDASEAGTVNMSFFPTSCVADVGFDAPTIADITPESGRLLSLVRVREVEDAKNR
jgi:phosphohistidine phosphatase